MFLSVSNIISYYSNTLQRIYSFCSVLYFILSVLTPIHLFLNKSKNTSKTRFYINESHFYVFKIFTDARRHSSLEHCFALASCLNEKNWDFRHSRFINYGNSMKSEFLLCITYPFKTMYIQHKNSDSITGH